MLIKYSLPLLVGVALALPLFETQGALLIPLGVAGEVKVHGLSYIGSFRNPIQVANETNTTTIYYASTGDASWEDAMEDCKTYLGENATLLNLETEEEMVVFQEWLVDHPTNASNYWTGGQWSMAHRLFEWSNGVPFGSWIPWDVGHPQTSFPITKVEFRRVNSTLATEFDSAASRYICEVDVEIPVNSSFVIVP